MRNRWSPLALSTVFALATASGCSLTLHGPDLGSIYDRAAMTGDRERNPIIVIPGILGSKLAVSGTDRVVWGVFGDTYADPSTPDGAALLALPMDETKTLSELHDELVPTGALDTVRVSLFGISVTQHAYFNILATLGVGGYRDRELGESGAIDYGDDHYTCFQFAYDWRLDLVENARRLGRFIESTREFIRAEEERRFGASDREIKFDIVAHSMGGLLTRYYLRYGTADLPEDGTLPPVTWKGAADVDRAILIGTPNAGSVLSLTQLVEGSKFVPFYPLYRPALLGTLPAVYQLLPTEGTGAVVDAATRRPIERFLDPELWESMGWGLADPEEADCLEWLLPDVESAGDRRRIALDHQRKCLERARRVRAALDAPAERPQSLGLFLFVGDAEDTPGVVAVDRANGEIEVAATSPGDGTVTRSSALGDRRRDDEWTPRVTTSIDWSRVQFIFRDHVGLTKDPTFTDNVLYLLLEEPRPMGSR